MRSCTMITATIIAFLATFVYSKPVSTDENNYEENVEKIGTLEEESEKVRKACDEVFAEIKANPSIVTLQKIFDDHSNFILENYEKLFKNYIHYCMKYFHATEPAPGEKHLTSIKDSLKLISL